MTPTPPPTAVETTQNDDVFTNEMGELAERLLGELGLTNEGGVFHDGHALLLIEFAKDVIRLSQSSPLLDAPQGEAVRNDIREWLSDCWRVEFHWPQSDGSFRCKRVDPKTLAALLTPSTPEPEGQEDVRELGSLIDNYAGIVGGDPYELAELILSRFHLVSKG